MLVSRSVRPQKANTSPGNTSEIELLDDLFVADLQAKIFDAHDRFIHITSIARGGLFVTEGGCRYVGTLLSRKWGINLTNKQK